MKTKSPFLKHLMMNLNIIIPVYFFLAFFLSIVQIYVLKKERVGAIVRSCLISGMISL